MSVTKRYFSFLQEKMDEVVEEQTPNIEKAAEIIAKSCENGGRFYVFGSGHSHMVAEELYLRAGGFGLVKAILPPELMLHEMANKSTWLERLDGYSTAIVNLYKIDEKDTIMIISNSGRNSVPVEMAIASKEKGAKVIALTSMKHGTEVTSRHHSGKKLYEIADVAIDNCADKGDASFYVDNYETPTGATSDATGIAIAQALIVTVIDIMVKNGHKPPVFKSSNVDGADEYNNELFDKYYGFWK